MFYLGILIDAIIVDFKNVSIVGHYVKDRTRDAQFIIIRYNILCFVSIKASYVLMQPLKLLYFLYTV